MSRMICKFRKFYASEWHFLEKKVFCGRIYGQKALILHKTTYKPMILIADSGSTKTAWCLCSSEGDEGGQQLSTHYLYIYTQGINPFQQTEEEICCVLEHELMEQIGCRCHDGDVISAIYFYGAGCTKAKSPVVASALRRVVAADARISVESDMLGAARGLCGKTPGVVGILGTGSNSCLYDGEEIVANVSPLGYILGDEGSGAYIGKRLVGDVLKKQMAEEVCQMFFDETHETQESIVQKVYREPLPNRFLASLSQFCARHREREEVRDFLSSCFAEFFDRNIRNYRNNQYGIDADTVHLVGSIAYYYKAEIADAAERCGFKIGNVLQNPLEGLVAYHKDAPSLTLPPNGEGNRAGC